MKKKKIGYLECENKIRISDKWIQKRIFVLVIISKINCLFFNREFFNIIKQTFLIFLLLISNENKKIIELTIIMILFLNTIIYLEFIPRISRILNFIEFLSSFSCFLIASFLFLLNIDSQNYVRNICFIFVLIIQLFFLSLLVYKLIIAIVFKYKRKIRRIFNSFSTKKKKSNNILKIRSRFNIRNKKYKEPKK